MSTPHPRSFELTNPRSFELTNRSQLLFSGPDRLRYLNGQVTQDLRKLSTARALPACVTSAKGRLQADVWISDLGTSLLVDAHPGVAETLLARLERYIVADDVSVEDPPSPTRCFIVWTNLHCHRQSSTQRPSNLRVWVLLAGTCESTPPTGLLSAKCSKAAMTCVQIGSCSASQMVSPPGASNFQRTHFHLRLCWTAHTSTTTKVAI